MSVRKPVRVLIVLLVLAIAGGSAWYLNKPEATDASRVVLYGNVDIRESDLAFNNVEHVDRMLVQEGDRVEKGQLLATLHSERTEAEVLAAEARVAAQKAVVARLEAGSRPEEVRQARANVAAAKARVTDAEATFKRARDLYKRKVGSKQALDDAEATLNTTKANLKVAQQALALAVEGPRVEDIDAAKATLRADEAQLVLAREILKDAKLYAPADGVIRNRILEPGDMASPQTPVYTLAFTDPVWVRSYLPETVMGKVKPGMAATVTTDSYPGKSYPGWVGFVSPTAEFTPKNVETPELRTRLVYQMRVYVCNANYELRLGMPATVTLALDQNSGNAAQIPDCARPADG